MVVASRSNCSVYTAISHALLHFWKFWPGSALSVTCLQVLNSHQSLTKHGAFPAARSDRTEMGRVLVISDTVRDDRTNEYRVFVAAMDRALIRWRGFA